MHRVTISDEETTIKEKDEYNTIREERLIQSSDFGAVTHTIFSPEKIQDLVPLGGNGALILGISKLFDFIPSEISFSESITSKLETFYSFGRKFIRICDLLKEAKI